MGLPWNAGSQFRAGCSGWANTGGEYPGEWVAIRDGQLLAHAFTLDELERQLGGSLKVALIARMV
jgi:hypothetical protein